MTRALLTLVLVAVLAIPVGAAAQAPARFTFVSGNGADTNPCTHVAPCRSFSTALALTAAGGDIIVLDAANYGRVTITQAVNIVNDGAGEAESPGITINAGASDIVNLRGLTLSGMESPDTNGITVTSVGTLNIQNCVVRGFSNDGISFVPSSSARLNVSDTIASDNSAHGIVVEGKASFERVQSLGNRGDGFVIGGANSTATAADSLASGNGGAGFSTGNSASLTLVKSKSISNYSGVHGEYSSPIYLANSTMSGNNYGFLMDPGGKIYTFGDNFITDPGNTAGLISIGQE